MTLQFQSTRADATFTIAMNGRLTVGDPCHSFRDVIRDAIADGERHIVLDFKDVSYVDSTGLGELVAALVAVRRSGGEIQLMNIPPRIQNLLEVSRLYTAFKLLSINTGEQPQKS